MKAHFIAPQAKGQSRLVRYLQWFAALAVGAVAVAAGGQESEGDARRSSADESVRENEAPAVATAVSRDEIAASEVPSPFAQPSPVAWFRVFEKLGSPRWRQFYSDSGSLTISNRPRAALKLGVTLTDAYVAVESRGSQEVRNVLADIRTLEKTLGISERMQQRNSRLGELADAEQWQALRVELEATMTEQQSVLREQRDGPLADLLPFGLLLRTIAINCEIVRDLELEDRLCIGDITLIYGMIRRVELLPEETLKERGVRDLRRCLKGVRDCWAAETAGVEVDRITVTQNLIQEFLTSLMSNE